MRIETLAIGDELLTGKIADSNSAWVGSQLFAHGLRLSQTHSVADDRLAIQQVLEELSTRADRVLVFGGLGPTTDDMTVETVAQWLGCQAVEHEPSKKRLIENYKRRGRELNPHSLRQVRYPKDCTVYSNSVGMAPGFGCQKSGCHFYFLPGVASEMKAIFSEHIVGAIVQGLKEVDKILTRQWNCIGVAESDLQTAVYGIEQKLPKGCWLGYRTTFPENHLTLYCQGAGASDYLEQFGPLIEQCVRKWSYSDGASLEQVVVDGFLAKKKRLVLVESCTGGLAAQRITQIPGASDMLWGGLATYQLAAKDRILGVQVKSGEEAVSADCSRRLAEAALKLSDCDVAAALTGWAGPTGGTESDPVGTVYLCVASISGECLQERRVIRWKSRWDTQWGGASHLLHAITLKS